MRQGVQRSLQTSLLDGRLSEVVAVLKEQRKAKEVESNRQNMQLTFQSSILDGRLFEVVSHMKAEKQARAAQSAQDVLRVDAPVSIPMPARPTFSKTTARPVRRSSRTGATAEKQELKTLQESPAAEGSPSLGSVPSSKAPVLPPRPPALVSASQPSSPKARQSMLSRPASPVGRLPPVTPPCRRQSLVPQSAMSLDLAGDGGLPSAPSAALWNFGEERMMSCHARSLSMLHMTKTPSKQAPSFLPPIPMCEAFHKASMGKPSAHKRSVSMDSYVWGVAPAMDSHVEWSDATRLVF